MSRNVQGILWIMVTGFLSVSIYTLARILGASFHPTQVVFFYSLLGMLFFLPYIVKQKVSLRTDQGALYAVRSVLEFSAFSLSFAAITELPFPVHATLEFTSPLFGSILAIVMLKEPNQLHRWMALLMGFVGVLIVTRPDVSGFSSASLLVLGAAFLFAFCGMSIKKLTQTEPPARIAFYMLAGTMLVAAPIAFSYPWQNSIIEHAGLLALLGVLVAGVQFTVANAFERAHVTLILPFFFLNLLWASLFAYIVFDEVISQWTLLGAVFIIGGAVYAGRHATKDDAQMMKDAEQAMLGA
jgi:drug/metabolite transporter (DMT)-like permease